MDLKQVQNGYQRILILRLDALETVRKSVIYAMSAMLVF
nr:MAG TPA: hypothetical protein [Caudoviricetes sp.]